jgi:hypothetical protein
MRKRPSVGCPIKRISWVGLAYLSRLEALGAHHGAHQASRWGDSGTRRQMSNPWYRKVCKCDADGNCQHQHQRTSATSSSGLGDVSFVLICPDLDPWFNRLCVSSTYSYKDHKRDTRPLHQNLSEGSRAKKAKKKQRHRSRNAGYNFPQRPPSSCLAH